MRSLLRVSRAVWTVVGGALTVVTAYLAVLTFAAWRRRRHRATPTTALPGRRFTVLVPAHDEAAVIADTMRSLAELDYPPDRVGVHVVADNCTDDTADIVRAFGFDVHERDAPDDPGKGPALEWLRARLDAAGALGDAVVHVDADTTCAPDLLTVLDAALSPTTPAVQVHYAVANVDASPVAAFRAAAFAARNYLRPLGRTAIGGTAGLLGTGMAFTTELHRTISWSAHLTEDAELQLTLLERGVRVAFCPAARVQSDMPVTLEASRTQHERWEGGRIDLARRHVPGLLRRAVAGGPSGRVAYADAALDLLVPPFSVVVAASGGWWTATALRWLARRDRATGRTALTSTLVVAAQAGYVLSALRMVEAPRSSYRALLAAPSMVAWKLGLWAGALVRRDRIAWVRTARTP